MFEKFKNNLFTILLFFLRYHYYMVDKFIKNIALKVDLPKNNKKLLDIGASESPFKTYFKNIKYYSQDIHQNSNNSIDYVFDICDISNNIVKDETFDYIICTQVLEHLHSPKEAFSQFNRILKKGGKLFLTTHLCFEEHMQPFDYYRFTRYGLRHLGESSGFKVLDIKSHGGIGQVLFYIVSIIPIKLFLKEGSLFYYSYLLLFSPILIVLSILCHIIDLLDKNKIITLNYEVIYEKIK